MVTLGVSKAKVSQRRPAMGRLSTEPSLMTCEFSVFSVSTTSAWLVTVTSVCAACTVIAKLTVSVWPT